MREHTDHLDVDVTMPRTGFPREIEEELNTLMLLRDRGRLDDAEFERRAAVTVCKRADTWDRTERSEPGPAASSPAPPGPSPVAPAADAWDSAFARSSLALMWKANGAQPPLTLREPAAAYA